MIPEGADITLEFADGVTLTNSSDHTITNNGTLTITGAGIVDNVTHQKSALLNNGTVTLDKGTFSRSAEASTAANQSGGNSYYVLTNHGTMTINDGVTVKFSDNNFGFYSSAIENGWYTPSQNTSGKDSVLTINGGVVTGGKITIKNDDYGVLTINGGVVATQPNSNYYALFSWNEAEINAGTINGAIGAQSDVNDGYENGYIKVSGEAVINGNVQALPGSNVQITGGTVTGAVGTYSGADSSCLQVTGGTFSDNSASAYVPAGLTLVESNDNSWVIGVDEDNVDAIAEAEDFGLWGEDYPGWYNVGWKYGENFNTDLISRIEVYLTDDEGKRIVTYTASGDQLVYQKENGYISGSKQSSAPFYKEYKGTEIAEGEDLDWTVEKGPAFDAFAAKKAYIEITVGDAVIKLENDCQHEHIWAADFTIDKEATTTETA